MPLTTLATVRLLIGDVDSADYALTDDQVQYFLDLYSDDARAAAPDAANAAANILTMRAVDESTGAMSVTLTRRAELYRQRAAELGGSAGFGRMAAPYVGGVLQSELDTSDADTTRSPRRFTRVTHETDTDDDADSLDS